MTMQVLYNGKSKKFEIYKVKELNKLKAMNSGAEIPDDDVEEEGEEEEQQPEEGTVVA